jgi:hypothetical protein
MRKIGLFAVAAALFLVGVGGWMEWVASTTQARVATPSGDPIDPMQMMMNAKNLPHAEFVDLSLEFH